MQMQLISQEDKNSKDALAITSPLGPMYTVRDAVDLNLNIDYSSRCAVVYLSSIDHSMHACMLHVKIFSRSYGVKHRQ
ncbi:hypothetical protein GUJ93_ZPchr0002g25698 [Zizania palustris]|uniref:Uncharacterized protein n=1 Tax=Zizania palustris TaxID=103762 RepID=A0A8J5VFX8_ZIZPA|nr:hypothetical protein GUJ93_ZPchr0002g25698 [Zizania palustris]